MYKLSVKNMKNLIVPLKIFLIYILFGFAWIYFSDRALAVLVPDHELYMVFQNYIGSFYVIFSGLVLFALIRSYYLDLEKTHRKEVEYLNQIRKISNSMVEGMLIVDVENQSFLISNRALQNMLGYSREEILNFKVVEGRGIDDCLQKLFSVLKEAYERGNIHAYEIPVILKDGSTIYVDLTFKEIELQNRNCLLAVFHDVSEKLLFRTKIAEERKFLKALLDVTGDIVLALNLEMEVILINKKGSELLGYHDYEILGKNWADKFLPVRIHKEVKDYFSSLKGETDIKFYHENPVLTKSGEEIQIYWYNDLLRDEEGKIYGVLSNGINITHLREAQKTVHDLSEYNRKLKELDDLKSLFIATMSHELRTPLNSIIGFTSIILEEWVGPLNDEQRENLSIVLKSGKYLLSLINDIIDVAKIEAGVSEMHFEEFELKELIEELVKNLSTVTKSSGLWLKLELTPVNIFTEKRRLTQCLYNLLSNALKFCEKGGVTICNHIFSDRLVITVEDTGMGMTPEEVNKLYAPFTRLVNKEKKIAGVGLGLYLTKKIINEILKGELLVESEKDKGSKFTIILPLFRETGEIGG